MARLKAHILEAYRLIGSATPLPADCGQLCDAACCQGDDHMGMLLFPGEMALLSAVPGYRIHRIPYMGGRAWHLSCTDPCDRELRPLACRIFPLAPRLVSGGDIEAVPDPRARPMCPLASGEHLDDRFYRRVEKAFRHLAREPRQLEFMARLSAELEELRAFFP